MKRDHGLLGSLVKEAGGPLTAGISSAGAIALLILANQLFNVGATTGFALSGRAQGVGRFVVWQAVGSVFGFGAQITFAGLARFLSVRLANAIGIGLAFVSAQLIGAFLLFGEPFAPVQWIGTALVFAGVLCIALGR